MGETITAGGVDLATYLTPITLWQGLIAPPQLQGDDIVVPGRVGAIAATSRMPGSRTITIGGMLVGRGTGTYPSDARARYLEDIRALGALLHNNGQAVQLNRTTDLVGGGTRTVTAMARYLGGLEDIEHLSEQAGRVAVELELLDGYWYASSTTTVTKTGAQSWTETVPGDAATYRMVVTFSGSSNQKLLNNTTGKFVHATGNNSTNPTAIDIDDFTATRNGANVLSELAVNDWSTYWFDLVPGANNLQLQTGGTVTIVYRAAYL